MYLVLASLTAKDYIAIAFILYLFIAGWAWAARLGYLIYKKDPEADSWIFLGFVAIIGIKFGTVGMYILATEGLGAFSRY